MDWFSEEGEQLDMGKLREEFILILDTHTSHYAEENRKYSNIITTPLTPS
jgi:hypothetical protein